MAPSVSFKTVGCRLNQAETASITTRFVQAGYGIVPSGSPADVAVIHGCAITRKAEHSSLYAARQAKRTRADTLVILAGCPAETLGAALRGETSIDLSVGQGGKYAIPDLLHRLHPDRFPAPPPFRTGPAPLPQFETKRALIKVQDGCDFRCAYCIVPAARGTPQSRPLQEVVDEVTRVTAAGFREIVLTGANLGRYEDGHRTLVDLVQAVEAIPHIGRIRLSSIEITTAEHAILDHLAGSTHLCRFLHIPLQSGDDGILKAMGRRYDAATYRSLLERATQRIPLLGLGTDIIVGFPGEDDQAFENTVRMVRELPFSNLHVFPYSQRNGTRAATMPGQIPEAIKKERLHILAGLGESKRRLFSEQFLGKDVSVLIERVDSKGIGHGWTGEYLEAEVTGPLLQPRQIVTLTVDRTESGRLSGGALKTE